MALCLLGR
jgi:hypothetical protein